MPPPTAQDIQNSEMLLDLSNQLIDSINERKKALKGINAEEQLYLGSVKQQQKLSQDITASAENYLRYAVKSKDLNKQIDASRKNQKKTEDAFATIEQKLIDTRRKSTIEARNINTALIKQKQELFASEQRRADLETSKQIAIANGDAAIAESLRNKIKDEATTSRFKLSEIDSLQKQLDKETQLRDSAKEMLKNEEKAKKNRIDEIAFLEKNLEIRKRIEKSTGLLGGLSKAVSKIPGIGQYLNADEAIEEMEKLAAEIEDAGGKSTSFANRLQIGLKGASVLVKGLVDNLKSPEAIITFIITQALKANAQVVAMGKSLGTSSEAYRENLANIARESSNINITTANLVESFGELAKATGFAYQFNEDQLTTQTKLTKQVGLTAEEAGKIANLGITTGKTSEETYKGFVKGLVATRNQLKVGIDMKATLAEAANVSGQLAANLGYNPELIAKAIVTAKAFGMTLDQVAKSGESLLNFESSIENELKAELLTGKQLNLEKARAAALTGDQATLAEELAKNIGTAADFTKMNVLQQKALAESVGMTSDELGNTLQKREAALASGKSLAQITEEEAAAALERQTIQDKFNAAILKLQDFFGNLVAGPVGQLLDVMVKIIGVISDVLQPVLSVVFTPLIWAAQLLEKMGGSLKYIIGLAIAYKGIQLGINIAKAAQFGLDAASLMKEEGSLGFKTASALVEKESLATKIATYAITGAMLVYERAKAAILFIQQGIETIMLTIKQRGLLLTIKDAWKSIAGAAMSAFESAAKIPFVGWILGIAAAGGAIALGASLMSKGNDVMSPGSGYGNRVLSTGEGSIALNNKDTVVAGTDLFGGGKKGESIQGPSIDLTPMIMAINAVKASVDRLYAKDQSINMDGKKVGTTLVQSSYKVA